MEYSIIFYKDSKQDIIEIVKWYDLKSVELSNRFILQVDEAINKIRTSPEAFSYLYKDIRKIKLRKFPYMIFYKIEKHTIHIYGVIHTKRNPQLYKKRLHRLI